MPNTFKHVVLAGFALGLFVAGQAAADPVYQFDFNDNDQSSSTLQSGWTEVLQTTIYNGTTHVFGFDSTVTDDRLRAGPGGALNDVYEDFVFSSSQRTFSVDLAAGVYDVTIHWYEEFGGNADHLNIDVFAEGESTPSWSQIDVLNHADPLAETRQVTVTDGTLDLLLDPDSGQIWTINGLEITYVSAVPEPATLALLALGGAGLAAFRRRRA